MKTTRQTGKFTAMSEDGDEHTILVFSEYHIASDLRNGRREVESPLKSLQTSDGKHVNYVEKGVYEVLGLVPFQVTSDDPNAP